MKIYTITQAQANFDRLVDEALSGEEVIIARRKTPVAKLEPVLPQESEPARPAAGKGDPTGTAGRRRGRSMR